MNFDKFDAYVKKDKNNRSLDEPNAVAVHTNSGCADNYTIYLNISDRDIIEESTYETDGCPFGKASCEITTELAHGLTLSEAEQLTTDEIEAQIDGYPPRRRTYPQQVLTAFRKALNNYDETLALPVDEPIEDLDQNEAVQA
jgi:NifU-like protein involved in Fe-S cluster formation